MRKHFSTAENSSSIEITAKIKQWVRTYFALPEDCIILVSEQLCSDNCCPDVETVITILPDNRIFRIEKKTEVITIPDIEKLSRQFLTGNFRF
jgi:hypothetical protein